MALVERACSMIGTPAPVVGARRPVGRVRRPGRRRSSPTTTTSRRTCRGSSRCSTSPTSIRPTSTMSTSSTTRPTNTSASTPSRRPARSTCQIRASWCGGRTVPARPRRGLRPGQRRIVDPHRRMIHPARHIGARTASKLVGKSSPSMAANAIGAPPVGAGGRRPGAHRGRTSRRRRDSSGWPAQLAADRRAVEHEHVHPEAREPHPLAVDHRQHALRLALDARSPRRPPSPRPRPASSRRRPTRSGTARSPSRPAARAAARRVRCRRWRRSRPSASRSRARLRRLLSSHSCTKWSVSRSNAASSSSSIAAALMSAATWSTSSKRSRS